MLIEVNDAQALGSLDGSGVGFHLPGEKAEQGRLAAAVGTDKSEPHTRSEVEVQLVKECPAAEFFLQSLDRYELLGFSARSAEVNLCRACYRARLHVGKLRHHAPGLIDTRLRLRGPSL